MANPLHKGLSDSERTILRLLKEHPEGLDIAQIRDLGGFGNAQQHLDRRLRALDPLYVIDRRMKGKRTIYKVVRERDPGEWDFSEVSRTMRAKILARDGRRCRMCGRTVDQDAVKLQVDHKIPKEWGGTTIEENLWALCSDCNGGKRNYFASFDADLMKAILESDTVHERLANLLHAQQGEWIECDLLEFVANFEDYQTDWRKRLRELRYFGLKIDSTRKKTAKRTLSLYRLNNWVALPNDVSAAAREFERKRARQNREPR